jgi:hypothetical protein
MEIFFSLLEKAMFKRKICSVTKSTKGSNSLVEKIKIFLCSAIEEESSRFSAQAAKIDSPLGFLHRNLVWRQIGHAENPR